MFQYVLGWFSVIACPIAVIVALIFQFAVGGSGYIWLRLIWMPFVFWWGLNRVREYREEKRLNNDNARR